MSFIIQNFAYFTFMKYFVKNVIDFEDLILFAVTLQFQFFKMVDKAKIHMSGVCIIPVLSNKITTFIIC